MADQIVLLNLSDQDHAQDIIDEFGERTGLQGEEIEGGMTFTVDDDEHEIDVVETLTDIDPDWTDHVSLGDPAGTENA